MKKYLIIIAILFLSCLNAEDVRELKIWKFFRIHEKSILITDSLEVWELNYFSPNKQTWAEWLSLTPAEELFGNDYIYQNKLWNEQSIILCSDYPWINSSESKIYRNNSSHLSLCTHILENINTKEKAFARLICTHDWKEICRNFYLRYALNVHLVKEEAREKNVQEQELFKFILRLIKGKAGFTVHDVLNNHYESSNEKKIEAEIFLAIDFAKLESIGDDEYSKYRDFENSFRFCSTILEQVGEDETFRRTCYIFDEQTSKYLEIRILYSYFNSYLQKKYKSFKDEIHR